jgi:hypothetical protein
MSCRSGIHRGSQSAPRDIFWSPGLPVIISEQRTIEVLKIFFERAPLGRLRINGNKAFEGQQVHTLSRTDVLGPRYVIRNPNNQISIPAFNSQRKNLSHGALQKLSAKSRRIETSLLSDIRQKLCFHRRVRKVKKRLAAFAVQTLRS